METCESFIGLDPPEFGLCDQPKGHLGKHRSTTTGFRRTSCGEYDDMPVVLEWENWEER